MKKYLNIIIIFFLLIISCLIFFNYVNNDKNELEAELNKIKKDSTPGIIHITNPIFKSKGLDIRPYTIRAKIGIQVGEDIELYEIVGELKNKDDKLFYINADKGLFNQQNQTIELINNVLIYDELGNRTSTQIAFINIDSKKITLTNDVISTSNTSIIESNTSVVDEINNTITYSGNVKVKIQNK